MGLFTKKEKIKYIRDEIQCKDCVFCIKDIVVEGELKIPGYAYGYCDVFPQGYTEGKPKAILWRTEDCIYYQKTE